MDAIIGRTRNREKVTWTKEKEEFMVQLLQEHGLKPRQIAPQMIEKFGEPFTPNAINVRLSKPRFIRKPDRSGGGRPPRIASPHPTDDNAIVLQLSEAAQGVLKLRGRHYGCKSAEVTIARIIKNVIEDDLFEAILGS